MDFYFKKTFVCVIILSLLVSLSLEVPANFENNSLVYTKVTDVSWCPYYYVDSNSSYSYFWFDIGFKKLNPNSSDIVITFHCWLRHFLGNMSADFDNSSLQIVPLSYYELPAERDVTIESGITNGTTNFLLGINQQNLTKLPEGRYKIWVYGNVAGIEHSKSLIEITENEIKITYIGFPNMDISFNTVTIYTSKSSLPFNYPLAIFSLFCIFLVRGYRKGKK